MESSPLDSPYLYPCGYSYPISRSRFSDLWNELTFGENASTTQPGLPGFRTIQ